MYSSKMKSMESHKGTQLDPPVIDWDSWQLPSGQPRGILSKSMWRVQLRVDRSMTLQFLLDHLVFNRPDTYFWIESMYGDTVFMYVSTGSIPRLEYDDCDGEDIHSFSATTTQTE